MPPWSLSSSTQTSSGVRTTGRDGEDTQEWKAWEDGHRCGSRAPAAFGGLQEGRGDNPGNDPGTSGDPRPSDFRKSRASPGERSPEKKTSEDSECRRYLNVRNLKKKRKEITMTAEQLIQAAVEGKAVYRGFGCPDRPFAAAFVVGMPFRTVMAFLPRLQIYVEEARADRKRNSACKQTGKRTRRE